MALVGFGILATGTLGFFGWHYFQKRKRESENANEITEIPIAPSYMPSPTSASSRNDDFPLKKGSKGARVKLLQEAIIGKYGKQSLSKYGADGDFGSELEKALMKNGLSKSIDESTFNVIVKSSSANPSDTAKELYKAAVNKDFKKVISLLSKLKNQDDYSAASDTFKTYRIGGVRQTLVNGLLNSFTTETQKQQIRLAFTKMGLTYDGKKWSLSGLDGLPIITHTPALIWKNKHEKVSVPASVVLGNEIERQGAFTLFENNGMQFLIETKNIKYL